MARETDETGRRYVRARDLIDRGRQALSEGHRLMRQLSAEVKPARARGLIHQQIWDCERMANRRAHFFSQSGQDAFLDERVFKGRREGTFVEIGGYDGLTSSNCLFFELIRGWSGILVEPAPKWHARAAEFRRAACLPVAVAAASGEAEFMEVEAGLTQMSGLVASYPPATLKSVEDDPRHKARRLKVRTRTLAQVLDAHYMDEVDFLSLDVGGAELAVLQGFPFERFRVKVWTIDGAGADGDRIAALMRSKGYKRVEALGADDIWLHDPA